MLNTKNVGTICQLCSKSTVKTSDRRNLTPRCYTKKFDMTFTVRSEQIQQCPQIRKSPHAA